MNHESSRDFHDPNFDEFVKITTQQFVHLHQIFHLYFGMLISLFISITCLFIAAAKLDQFDIFDKVQNDQIGYSLTMSFE